MSQRMNTLNTFLQQHGLAAHAAKLTAYAALIRQWNPKINLVSPTTLPELDNRHLLDSAQLLTPLHPEERQLLDVGSGAGLPGLVLAILSPERTVTVAERDQRKAAFLLTARHQLGLSNVTVHAGDVRTLAAGPQRFDVITGRAFTATANFIAMTTPLLAPGRPGRWLLLKGESVSQELAALSTLSPMTITQTPSITDAKGWVVSLQPAAPPRE